MSETNKESWDGLLKNFLKAEHLALDEETFVCIDVTVEGEEMELVLEFKGKKATFGLNVTNKVFLKGHGIEAPKDVIGKKITLRKVKAYNPTLKQEVDGLRISKVEKIIYIQT